MKKILIGVVVGVSLLMAACGNQAANALTENNTSNPEITEVAGGQTEEEIQDAVGEGTGASIQNPESKALVVYFAVAQNSAVDAISSASVVNVDGEAKGRIQVLADDIRRVTDGELFSIQTSVAYPGNGGELIDYADQELKDNARPELTSTIENLEEYGTIFIGYPTWWYDLPMVMYSFFEEYDFSGKTIVPFNTHNGSRFSGTIETIQELESGATVITDGFTVNERDVTGAEPELNDWLESLGY